MALRFLDGFDHYATTDITRKWTIRTGTASAIHSPGRNGSCLRFTSGSSNALTRTLDNQSSWVMGFAFQIQSPPTFGSYVMAAWQDAGSVQVDLRLNTDLTLSVTRNGSSLTGGSSSSALAMDTWYYLEWKVTISNSIAANSCKVRVNAVDWINVAAGQDTQATSNPSANQLRIGQSTSGGALTVLFDDLYVLDGTGTINNDFLGDMRVITLLPNGVGNSSGWTPLSGSNFANVDDAVPDDDATYNYSSVAGQKDTHACQDLPIVPSSIAGLQVCTLFRKDEAGARQAAAVVRSAGTDYDGSSYSVTDSYAYNLSTWQLDPATSALWTASAVNSAEFGYKLVS